MQAVEDVFHRAMLGIYDVAKNECGYKPIRFLQKVHEVGGLRAAKEWLSSHTPQEGLSTLWELHRLDISMEALVLSKQFRELFTGEELAEARRRLRELNYVVSEES